MNLFSSLLFAHLTVYQALAGKLLRHLSKYVIQFILSKVWSMSCMVITVATLACLLGLSFTLQERQNSFLWVQK